MSQYDRKANAVRDLLDNGTPPSVPPELYEEAVRRGGRMLRRRRALRRLLWLLLLAAAVAFVIWASIAQPWVEPPSETTPPLTRW
jgi:ferric-dicitrate binding protein FerR (iron transport regulator)